MAVCALTMLDGMAEEATAAGGVLLLVLALVFAWLSTHVADRGDHILGTILTVGAHASLIGLGGHDGYSAGSPGADSPEQQATEGVRTDLLLDIQSKPPQVGRLHTSDDEEDEDEDEEEEEEDEEELGVEDKKILKHIPVLSSIISPTTDRSISVRLKYLNDTEEVAVVEPQDTVGVLKSKYFSGREHQIKLIYQGQLLQDPKKTLVSLNITQNSVIHCHVSQALHETTPEEGAQPGAGVSGGLRAAGVAISTSSLVVPVFVVILAVVWYFRINYRQFFTAPATISLVGVTVFFSFLIFGMHSR
uniref:Transmembrane and ubiquitin-like domain containing 2 n=1 Tax=Gasterosteus aculeatus aculeatus TaxID=481459 RepID=A0AAQ4RRU6_GASAC